MWYRDGGLHNDFGPAVIYCNQAGEQDVWIWYQLGKVHRDNGPAIVRDSGYCAWYRDGVLHRVDGPAIEREDGSTDWYIDGKLLKPFTLRLVPYVHGG
jgi:hypothetical protein